MKILYFDVFAGISGDMCLGALVDLGCPAGEIRAALQDLEIPGFDLHWEPARRGPLTGLQAHVTVQEEHHVHRTLADVLSIVDRTAWPGTVREQIEKVFTALAQAEGRIHGKPYDQIHFHEVGSFDAIVDICGTLLAVHLLGVERCAASKIHVGEGFVETRHGKLPLPVPASAALLEGFSIYSTGRPVEMVTPTGAALLRVLAGESSSLPSMTVERIGYGAGSREADDLPNMLRVFLGSTGFAVTDTVTVIETNIDDMNPEFYEPLMDALFQAGALDVSLTPQMMKKNRPGTLLSVIAPPALRETLARVILSNSSSIGLRMHDCERRVLQREAVEVQTPWGLVRGKVCWGPGVSKRFTPEFEDCRRIHQEFQIPLAAVYQEAVQGYWHPMAPH
ncbi:MAG TPA: nickel pincer cofactor biosynthesis protein LarC [bacterium]|nr:nickel pincer cofactor biosynthesis protein LarC [bacterium]HOL95467.1 nickel pincer cofactor biosynthesis protein LarC [bacterium]HPP00018.1 nickel pincer cofactor biosynthesis protein LarC [bacterium]